MMWFYEATYGLIRQFLFEKLDLEIKKMIIIITMKENEDEDVMRMMRYLVKTDYLSGSWVRIKKESFTGVAATAGTLTHLRGELSGGSWTRRCSSALPSQVHTHISRTHLRLDMLAYSPESSDVPCECRINFVIWPLIRQYLVFWEKLKNSYRGYIIKLRINMTSLKISVWIAASSQDRFCLFKYGWILRSVFLADWIYDPSDYDLFSTTVLNNSSEKSQNLSRRYTEHRTYICG